MNIIYDGGKQQHMTSDELYAYMAELEEGNDRLPMDERSEMSDRAAQTVAAMWHSPASPTTTLLSTMGKVSDDMSIADFRTHAEYLACDATDRMCLDYLATYILAKQLGR